MENVRQQHHIEQPPNVENIADLPPIDNNQNDPGHQEANPVIMELPPYSRSPNTSNACIFFECRHTTRCRVPEATKKRLLMDCNYYVPDAARVCEFHLQSNDWEALLEAPNISHSFNSDQIIDIINTVKQVAKQKKTNDFENLEDMNDDDLYYWTGRTKQDISAILNETPSLNECGEPKTALSIMLAKLTTGDSNERLALIFHMSRRKLERLMKSAREALNHEYVTRYLGWDHIERETLLQRNLLIPNALYNNPENSKLIIVIDGSYVYINKSSNFGFQIETYSPHKYLNLLKVYMIVCSDGYIIEVTGPHGAKKSDASITLDILNNEEHPFHVFCNQGDVFILDRGFRDCIGELEALGYEAHMPASVAVGETQLTTSEANESRMLTMVRWVVEVVNGRIKRDFKLFRQEYCHSAMTHMFADFRIAAALTNAFHVPITDNIHATAFLERIALRREMQNVLAEYVQRQRLNVQRVAFENMDAELPGLETFPRLTQDDLILLGLGSYQLKLANSYYAEHIRENGVYSIGLYRDSVRLTDDLNEAGIPGESLWLLRGRIQSRHTSARKYYSYVVVKDGESGLDAIEHYYCSCKAGKRTVGCCAHIMVIIWYLSYARYEDYIHQPAQFLDDVIIDE